MAESRNYKDWHSRIQSGVFTKAQCQQWAKVVPALAHGMEPRGKRTNLTADEARKLVDELASRGGVRLTAEHSAQGLAWIRNYHAREFPTWVTESFDHFSYQGGTYNIGNEWYARYVPVWRVHGTSGQTLDYCAAAWQSGKTGPRILAEDNDGTTFGTLHPNGTVTNTRVLSRTSILACPHVILVPEHYRADGTCRCDDPEHVEMSEWEYTWNGARWV